VDASEVGARERGIADLGARAVDEVENSFIKKYDE
jgi:hypothetical protein